MSPMVKAVLSSTSSRAAAFVRVSRVFIDSFEVWLSMTLSPREAWQAQATPRVDVAEVPVAPS